MPSRDAGIPDPSPSRRPIAGRVGAAPRGAPPPPPPGLTAAPDAGQLLKALGRRWLLALGLGVGAAGLAGAGAWGLLSPKHVAFSQIRVAAQRHSPIAPDRSEGRHEFNTYLKSQAGAIKNRFVLNAAVNSPEVKRLNLEHKVPDVVLWLEEELKVEFQADSEWVKVSLGADDPEDARVVVNAVTEAYKKEVVEKEETARSDNVRQFEQLYTKENNTLRAKVTNLKNLTQKQPSVDSEANKFNLALLQSSLAFARSQHGQASKQLAEAKGRLEALKAQGKRLDSLPVSDGAVDEAIENDPSIREDRDRLKKLRQLMKSIEDNTSRPESNWRYTEARKRVKDIEEGIEARRAELKKDLVSRARQKLKADHETQLIQAQTAVGPLADSEKGYRAEVEELARKVQDLSGTTAEYDYLKAEIDRDTQLVAKVAENLQRAQYDLHSKPRVSVAQDAALMARDIKKQALGSVVGAGASLVVCCFGVAWWEFRRRRVRSTDEVASGLGIRVVGSVPAAADVEQIINVPADELVEGHAVLESVDAIRTQLLHDANAQATRILLVTSAEPGEGKTTLASHLAGSLARAGRKTLLIDGDLRRPALHLLFEVQEQPGFSEVLLGEVDTVDTVLTTNQEGLLVMPAGQWDREVVQALARGSAAGILEKLKEEFDFIVIDSHPVLAATDSVLIGQTVDAVILSVLRDVSQTPRVYAATQRLQGVGIRVLGAVVNGADPGEMYVPVHGYSAAPLATSVGEPTMLRILPAATAVLAVITAGIVHGFWTDRWQLAEAVADAVARLDDVPRAVGDWQGGPLETAPTNDPGIPGQLYLRYVNRKTGDAVSIALVCGRVGPVSIHTPDVCYKASGYAVARHAPFEVKFGNELARFYTTEAAKEHAADPTRLRIFWSWYAGGRWEVSDNPRFDFARLPVLFKFYAIREVTPGTPLEADPCVDFLRQFLPELGRALGDG